MIRPAVLIPILALLVLFLGWGTYEEWREPVSRIGAPAAGAPSAEGAAVEPPPAAADTSLSVAVILARPLFRPDRRTFRPDTPDQGAGQQKNYDAELDRYQLLGILHLETGVRAIVIPKSPGRGGRWDVGPGETLGMFLVRDVREEGVTLAADGREFLLPLYAGPPKTTGASPIRTEVAAPHPPAPPPSAAPVPATAQSPQPPPPARANPPAAVPAAPPPAVLPPPPSRRRPPPEVPPGYRGYRR